MCDVLGYRNGNLNWFRFHWVPELVVSGLSPGAARGCVELILRGAGLELEVLGDDGPTLWEKAGPENC